MDSPRHGSFPAPLVGFLTLCLLSAATACQRQPEEPAAIRIGYIIDQTSLDSDNIIAAARLATAQVNDAGGLEVGGERHRVVLIHGDPLAPAEDGVAAARSSAGPQRTTPEDAVDAARRLIHQQQVIALVGPTYSREAIPVANLAERAHIPMISPGATHPETTAGKRHVFRVPFTDPLQAQALARFAVDELGVATAAVLYDIAEIHIRDLAVMFQEAFAAAGGQVVAAEFYPTGDRDFTRQLRRIRDRRPEALFLPNFDTEVLAPARQARELGLDAILLGSDGWAVRQLAPHPELDGAFLIQHWHPGVAAANPQARAFLAAYRRAYDQDPVALAALTYDAFGLLFQAIRNAERIDPESIRQGLSRIERYPGVSGAISFRDTGGDPHKPILIVQMRQGTSVIYQEIHP